MRKKPGKPVKLAALSYQERSQWQDLTRSERQRFLDRGKLTARDLSVLEELGLDASTREERNQI